MEAAALALEFSCGLAVRNNDKTPQGVARNAGVYAPVHDAEHRQYRRRLCRRSIVFKDISAESGFLTNWHMQVVPDSRSDIVESWQRHSAPRRWTTVAGFDIYCQWHECYEAMMQGRPNRPHAALFKHP